MEFIVLHPDEGDDGPFRWTKRTGWCDGEHPGRCKPCCDEYEVTIKATPKIKQEVLDGAALAVVEIEQL